MNTTTEITGDIDPKSGYLEYVAFTVHTHWSQYDLSAGNCPVLGEIWSTFHATPSLLSSRIPARVTASPSLGEKVVDHDDR